ncbi:hypothetical protein BV898_19503 [Hypsibius exemplaris]|uniref:Transposase Tc5 C-terminal domain-containing protein n=1 Tax=Hypsibius exemplaris TaxID=2072580 RepID=A0A9X6NLT7_HYPEX|nr:hypothetical protein BV898_19503 [Hypsibius exemplaris]
MWRYGWKKAGYLDEAAEYEIPGSFLTPVQFCFTGSQAFAAEEYCEFKGERMLHFISCAWCKKPLCFEHFFSGYHYHSEAKTFVQ